MPMEEHAYSDASSDDECAQEAEILPSTHYSKVVEDQQSSSSSIQHISDVVEVVGDTASEITTQKKKKKRKKKKSVSTVPAAAETVEISKTETDTNSSVQVTGWLSSFLSKKRTFEICPPPEIELSNDTYLKQFNSEFALSAHELDDISDVNSESEDEQVIEEATVKPLMAFDGDNTTAVCDDVVESDAAIAQPAGSSKLSFYNLPYSITAEEIIQFAAKLGHHLTNVVLGFDKRKNLPSGSATAELAAGVDVNACVTALQGENCGGRPVRVAKSNADSKRRMSGGKEGSRYFANDLSFKCQACGEVGHKQFECTNDPIPTPCHLCAGRDHEAVSCPNITCYRCGLFGHHSRDCRNPPTSRPVICTQCGSTTHDARQCHDPDCRGRHDSRVFSRAIRCVSCNQYGHTMCQALPRQSHGGGRCVSCNQYGHTMCQALPRQSHGGGHYADVYCPNCGEKGHHIDFPAAGGHGCRAPKYEAYIKYNRLLQDIDSMPHDKNNYYRDLIRHGPYSDIALFPSLLTASASGGGNSGRTFNMLPSYLPPSDVRGRDNNYRESFGGNSRSNHNNNGNYCANNGNNRGRHSYGGSSSRQVSDVRNPTLRDARRSSFEGDSAGYNNKRGRGDSGYSSGDSGVWGERQRHQPAAKKSRKSWSGHSNSSESSSGDRNHGNDRNEWPKVAMPIAPTLGGSIVASAGEGRSEFQDKVEARRRRFGDIA